jgi:hypothetical protein
MRELLSATNNNPKTISNKKISFNVLHYFADIAEIIGPIHNTLLPKTTLCIIQCKFTPFQKCTMLIYQPPS